MHKTIGPAGADSSTPDQARRRGRDRDPANVPLLAEPNLPVLLDEPMAKGYLSSITNPAGTSLAVPKDINATVCAARRGDMKDERRIGSVIDNPGAVNGLGNVKSVRIAQETFGRRALDSR